jgi:hypothetical protein
MRVLLQKKAKYIEVKMMEISGILPSEEAMNFYPWYHFL